MNNNLIRMPHPKLHKLKALLPSLNKDQRIAIHLRFWEECSIFEIAETLNKSWDTVDELIESTLNALCTELTKPEEEITLAA